MTSGHQQLNMELKFWSKELKRKMAENISNLATKSHIIENSINLEQMKSNTIIK